MAYIVLILSALGGALLWWVRSNPGEAIDAVQDVGTVIRNAPRKLAFRRQMDEHPVEGIDDKRIAIGAIAQAFVQLDDLPTKEQRDAVRLMLRTKLKCNEEEAQEIAVLSGWLIGQCSGTNQAISRISRRLYKIDGDASWSLIQIVLTNLVAGELSQSQIDAVEDIRIALHK